MNPREQGYADAMRGLTIDTNCPTDETRAAYRAGWRDGDDAKEMELVVDGKTYTKESYANMMDALARGRAKPRRSVNKEVRERFDKYKHLSLGN